MFGYFKEIVNDNGPPFNSTEFIKFLKNLGIKVTITPIYHPSSNGQAEKGVEMVKNSLKKYLLDEKLKGLYIEARLDLNE